MRTQAGIETVKGLNPLYIKNITDKSIKVFSDIVIKLFALLFPPIRSISEINIIQALSGGYNSVKLRWDNLEGTREYAIYRSKQVDGIYERIGKLPSTACSYTDKGLATGTTYFYKVFSLKFVLFFIFFSTFV